MLCYSYWASSPACFAAAGSKLAVPSSAIIGGAPIFKLAAGNIIRSFDFTAGVMVSIAMIAAMVVGEYSAAALVAFMMLVGEMFENFTIARADNALKELESLLPEFVVTMRTERSGCPSLRFVKAISSSYAPAAESR